MRIERRYTKANQSAYAGIEFRSTTSEIRNPDGSVVLVAANTEARPRSVAIQWRDHATTLELGAKSVATLKWNAR